jgi:hypothetical protein
LPRFDKTGPEGKGPRTGRGMGDCKPGDEAKTESRPVVGRGIAFRRGRGRW